MRSEICKYLVIACLIAMQIADSACWADSTRTLIIYPNVNAPAQRIYASIIEGIKQTSPLSESLAVDKNIQSAQLEVSLKKINPGKIIALGRTLAEKIKQTDYRNKMIVAATLFDPAEYPGVSLSIDSRVLHKKIKLLLPLVKKVFVFDDLIQPSITLYPENLKGQPLFTPLYHKDPLINARTLWKLLDKEASTSDAILLPSNLDRDILYELAQLAWEKKIILLSTNLAQLKEGVLMTFYPDNLGMGRQIGSFVIKHNNQGYQTLAHIHVALNPSIAKHLGLEFSADALSQFRLQVK